MQKKDPDLAELNSETLFDVWIEIPGVNKAPSMMLQLAINWSKDPATFQSDSFSDIILIIRQALNDNAKLTESMRSLN